MRALLLAALISLLSAGAVAQPSEKPVLEMVFEEDRTVPGQTLSLQLTILVPTYMPNPPVWPTFEYPNLLVKLPPRASGPTSRRINGETWPGITRRYLLSPMVAGEFRLPAQDVRITYADPATNKPVTTRLKTGPITLSGVVPPGAEQLDPFISAEAVQLEQTVTGNTEKMSPGDSVVWEVAATIEGAAPMFLPDLLPTLNMDGFSAYYDEPVLEETNTTDGGRRVERVTLIAKSGGSWDIPSLSLGWYDIKSETVKTASTEGFSISVDAPVAEKSEPVDWRMYITTGLAVLVLAWLCYKWVPVIYRRIADGIGFVRKTWLESPTYAHSRVMKAVRRRDFKKLNSALERYGPRAYGTDPHRSPSVRKALFALGECYYQTPREEPTGEHWHDLRNALAALHYGHNTPTSESSHLDALNPS